MLLCQYYQDAITKCGSRQEHLLPPKDTRLREAGAEVVYCLTRGAPKGPNLPRARLNHQDALFPGHGKATHSQTWAGEPAWLEVRGDATLQTPAFTGAPCGAGPEMDVEAGSVNNPFDEDIESSYGRRLRQGDRKWKMEDGWKGVAGGGPRTGRPMSPSFILVGAAAAHMATRLVNPHDSDRPTSQPVLSSPPVAIFEAMVADGDADHDSWNDVPGEDCVAVMAAIGEKVECPVSPTDLDIVHRVPTKNGQQNIIALFCSRDKKNEFVKKARKARLDTRAL
ncbi:hypothetical protein HPB47_016728, partial [Ixodes persulcatus]